MKFNKLKLQKGFTIIEVMIVLAIAGLIMVIVFIAVPQLQRSQRNTSRKSIMGRIKTEIDNAASNNNGSIPSSQNGAAPNLNYVIAKYLNGVNINDPQTAAPMLGNASYQNSGSTIAPGTVPSGVTLPAVGTAYYHNGDKCNGEALVTAGTRNYALWTQLEGGAVYCLDNQ